MNDLNNDLGVCAHPADLFVHPQARGMARRLSCSNLELERPPSSAGDGRPRAGEGWLIMTSLLAVLVACRSCTIACHARTVAHQAKARAWKAEQLAVAAHVRADVHLKALGVALLDTSPPDRPRARHLRAVPTGGESS